MLRVEESEPKFAEKISEKTKITREKSDKENKKG